MKKSILFALTLLTMLIVPLTSFGNDTDTLSKGNPFSFDLLPQINRDLKICDLVKENNVILNAKIVIQDVELGSAKAELKTEKRKRKVGNVVRTVIEIGVVILVIIL